MHKIQRSKFILILILTLILSVTACGAGEKINEELVEGAAEQLVGEGAIATSEAFVAAAATESAAIATENGTTTNNSTNSTEGAGNNPTSTTQNDANSGGDAGMADAPLPVVADTNLPGSLSGIQNGGDTFDVYEFRADAHQIVRVTAYGDANNTDEILFDLSSSGGHDTNQAVSPGNTAVLLLASANDELYQLHVSHGGAADTAVYQFDIVIEDENDANSGADAPDAGEQPLPVAANLTYRGASVNDHNGGNNVDCYQITLANDGGIQVDFSSPATQPYESFVSGELYGSNNELITSNTAQFGSHALLEYGIADYETAVAGDYTFCLTSYEFYAYGEYEFTVTTSDSSGHAPAEPVANNDGGANDACLVGTWRITNFDEYLVASVRDVMADQSLEVASSSSGELLITFDGTNMSMSDNGFVVTMTLMGVTTPTAVDATGQATYNADGSILTGYVETVDVVENNTGFGINLAGLVGNPVNYLCDGNNMSWSGPYAVPLQFAKINE